MRRIIFVLAAAAFLAAMMMATAAPAFADQQNSVAFAPCLNGGFRFNDCINQGECVSTTLHVIHGFHHLPT
jgi:hypothetical protein